MRARLASGLVGAVFGATLSWTGMSSPVVIRRALLFEDSYLFLMFGSAVLTAFVGLRVLKAIRARALLTDEPIAWSVSKPERRNVVGSLMFGTGWAFAGACPGPVATQLGQGVAWSLFTIVGILSGIVLFKRRRARVGRARSPGAAAAPATLL